MSIEGVPEPEPNAVSAVTVVAAEVPRGFAALSSTVGKTNLNVKLSFHSSCRAINPVSMMPPETPGPDWPNGAKGISTCTMKSYGLPAVVSGTMGLTLEGVDEMPIGTPGRYACTPLTCT